MRNKKIPAARQQFSGRGSISVTARHAGSIEETLGTTHLVLLQMSSKKVRRVMDRAWLAVMLKGRMISVHSSHCHLTCPGWMYKGCTVFEYPEVDPNVYFFCSPSSPTPQCTVWLPLSIWMFTVSFINLPLDPTVSQLNSLHTFLFPFCCYCPPVYA
jgi:hypothetical protein